ncbi:MAG: hypothetical protein P1V20_18100 [Verrucomicrobiales bacterium]|nr:hypothetical protein [Verrucomicrobiales bacterium]
MSKYRTDYLRRGIGILVLVLPFALVAASIIFRPMTSFQKFAIGVALLAMSISILNFWLAFLRPLLWRRKHGGMNDYRYISGLPVIGTILAVASVLIGFGHPLPAIMPWPLC